MAKNEMTYDKKKAIVEIIKWYWETVEKHEAVLGKSEYEFLYDLWENSLEYYDTKVQSRLNIIRDIYIENHPSKKKTFKL